LLKNYNNPHQRKIIKLFYIKTNHYSLIKQEFRVGKKAGNTHISQDGGKYWEIMDSVINVQIYKIDIGKLIFVKKNIDFDRNIKKIILYL
jgi:hypothetical protein